MAWQLCGWAVPAPLVFINDLLYVCSGFREKPVSEGGGECECPPTKLPNTICAWQVIERLSLKKQAVAWYLLLHPKFQGIGESLQDVTVHSKLGTALRTHTAEMCPVQIDANPNSVSLITRPSLSSGFKPARWCWYILECPHAHRNIGATENIIIKCNANLFTLTGLRHSQETFQLHCWDSC